MVGMQRRTKVIEPSMTDSSSEKPTKKDGKLSIELKKIVYG